MSDSDVVSFDVGAAIAGIESAIAGIESAIADPDVLHVVAVFTPDTYELAYTDDLAKSFYPSDDEMTAHFDRIHQYAGIDFSEIGLFVDDLFPVADGLEYMVTGLDYMTLVRVYAGQEGLFLSVDPGTDPTVVVDGIRDAIDVDLGAAGGAITPLGG
jgi:hypothetical protein